MSLDLCELVPDESSRQRWRLSDCSDRRHRLVHLLTHPKGSLTSSPQLKFLENIVDMRLGRGDADVEVACDPLLLRPVSMRLTICSSRLVSETGALG
jgi:hypothetical protein